MSEHEVSNAVLATDHELTDAQREAMRKEASEAVRMMALWKLLESIGGTMTVSRMDFETTRKRRMKVGYTVETDEYTLTLVD